MDCRQANELLDACVDDQLSSEQETELRRHIEACPACRDALAQLESLAGRLEAYAYATQVTAPPELWNAIEARLDSESRAGHGSKRVFRLFRRPLAIAASLAFLIGGGALVTVMLDRGVQTVQAADIDYSVLMNGVATDVHGAMTRFLDHYHAEPIGVTQAHEFAPELSFALPPELPGGYRFVAAYRMQFGKSRGIAAAYDRNGEPVFLIFHPMKDNVSDSGSTMCMIGGMYGSQIEVPPWRLLHMMDDTTCHCVLTRLEPGRALEAIVQAVAPEMKTRKMNHHPQ